MKLVTSTLGKAGTKILVNGTTYDINDANEVDITKAKQADYDKLLSCDEWHEPGDEPVGGTARRTAGIQLLDAGGAVVDTSDPEDDVDEDNFDEDEDDFDEDEDSKPQNGDPPIPGEGEEWADPQESFSEAWLHACAAAYDVKFPKNIKPKTLCKKILGAMYK